MLTGVGIFIYIRNKLHMILTIYRYLWLFFHYRIKIVFVQKKLDDNNNSLRALTYL